MDEVINFQLAQLHTDILALHFSFIADRMHANEMIGDDQYKTLLTNAHKMLDQQFQLMTKDISHSEQSG